MNAFFTICARNYLAFASLLGESVLRHHPDASFTIWLLDGGELPELPAGVEVRQVTEVVSARQLDELRLYYDILELATAVKPLCFRQHFAGQAGRVVYLDPDILVFRPLAELFELLDGGATGVLTPHVLAPLPRDDASPSDLILLRSGVYNLGFLALARGADADELLEWWWGWLRTHCFHDVTTGTFVDQKWMNFAPLFWSRFVVLRDSSYNVAYWNLTQRRLEHRGDAWLVDGRPLTFFHYSGFDPRRPELLSKHQSRVDVRRGTPLAEILELYAGLVMARGHDRLSRLELPAVAFDNGIAADGIAREAFRRAVAEGLSFRRPLQTGIGSFFSWLCAPVFRDVQTGAEPPITRYLLALYEMRADVRQVYPDLYGADRERFVNWAREKAVVEMAASPALLERQLPRPPAPATESPTAVAEPAALAVNLAGYYRAALGVGEAARGYARALAAQGIALHRIDATPLTTSPLDHDAPAVDDAPDATTGSINLIHVNADELPRFAGHVGPRFLAGRYNIGIWAWETQDFPAEWHDRFALLDEVWAGSRFIADAIARVAPIPVLCMPHVVEVPRVAPDRERFRLGDDEFLFLFSFDFRSVVARKNPEGLIEAFRRAFAPAAPVRLVLKSINGDERPADLARLWRAADGLRVTFMDETLSGEDRHRLLASCDAYVSLHRAEGFGLGLAEAMAHGKPVIGTGWSGNTDFMNPSNSLLVRYTLRALERDEPPYRAGTLWADPDLDHAAELMRRVRDDRELAARLGSQARADIESGFGPQAIGRRMCARLETIRAGRPAAVPPAAPVESSSPVPPPVPAASLGVAARFRAATIGGLRAVWRVVKAVTPARYQPRLQRLSARARRLLSGTLAE